jgi:hypothetical protein
MYELYEESTGACDHGYALVKELIAGLFSEDYARPSQRKIALLLLEILSEAPPLTMALPMPNDERLFSAARLLVNQRWEASLSELAYMRPCRNGPFPDCL